FGITATNFSGSYASPHKTKQEAPLSLGLDYRVAKMTDNSPVVKLNVFDPNRSARINAPENQVAIDDATEVWDEEKLNKAMATMKEIHIKLRSLRTTIPRLLAPLAVQQPTPDSLYREFSQAIINTNQEIQDFRNIVSAEKSLKVFEHTREYQAKNPRGIRPWKFTEHPDWFVKDS
ncbi:BgTH12-02017, partial [Blumeria graminis f. sp. triticale]